LLCQPSYRHTVGVCEEAHNLAIIVEPVDAAPSARLPDIFGSLNRRCAIINASDFCDLYAVLDSAQGF
jgi:hypothetical protein